MSLTPVPTKRARIVNAIFEVVSKALDGTGEKWRTMSRTPLISVKGLYTPAFSVFDFQEQITQSHATGSPNELEEARLLVLVEFWLPIPANEEYSDHLNYLLGLIQQRVGAIPTANGYAKRLQQYGSKFKMDGQQERLGIGEVIFQADFQRISKDPFKAP